MMWSQHSAACSCIFFLNFCENTETNSLVFAAEVIEKYNGNNLTTYMDIKINEEIQGSVSGEMFTVVNHGTTCDVSFDRFEIGDIIITKFIDTPAPVGLANFPMFSFSACSTSFLRKEGNTVLGNIEEGVSSKNYDDFKSAIDQCAKLTILDKDLKLLEDFTSIFPNPTSDFIQINIPYLNPEELSGELFSSNGQLIASYERLPLNNERLDLRTLPKGVYFIRISFKEHSIVRKIVKW